MSIFHGRDGEVLYLSRWQHAKLLFAASQKVLLQLFFLGFAQRTNVILMPVLSNDIYCLDLLF